jgi:hypothetical protein
MAPVRNKTNGTPSDDEDKITMLDSKQDDKPKRKRQSQSVYFDLFCVLHLAISSFTDQFLPISSRNTRVNSNRMTRSRHQKAAMPAALAKCDVPATIQMTRLHAASTVFL